MENGMAIYQNTGVYCSMQVTTDEQKKQLFNAVMDVDDGVRECINKVIDLTDIYIEKIQMPKTDDATGEVIDMHEVPRIILFDKDGKSYGCCSTGIYQALSRLVALYGDPSSWEYPIKVMPYIITKGKNQILSLKLV